MDQLPQSWLVALDRIKFHAKDAISTVTGCVCQQQNKLKINGRTCAFHIVLLHLNIVTLICSVNILRVLGEGGFSFVYLVQDEASGVRNNIYYHSTILIACIKREFALKKIFCPNGFEGVKQAMREVEAYRRFK
jgi:serine/threonine kinase 16